MNQLFYLVPVFGIVALLYTFIQSAWVSKQPAGNERMQEMMVAMNDIDKSSSEIYIIAKDFNRTLSN